MAYPGRNITPWLGWNTWSSELDWASVLRASFCKLTSPGRASGIVVATLEVGKFLWESTHLHAVARGVLSLLDGPDACQYFFELALVLPPFVFEVAILYDLCVSPPLRKGAGGLGQSMEPSLWSLEEVDEP